MKHVILQREYKDACTFGLISLPDGEVIHSLENPWINNERNISCIPEGVYICNWMERSGSGKYKRVWHVTGVPERSGVLFHAGNTTRDTFGCILPGMRRGKLGGVDAVLSSGAALNRMRSQLSGESFVLIVHSFNLTLK